MRSTGDSRGKHALVFGASGVTGWAIVNQILDSYPSADTFTKVTALTNRPLSPEAAQWPKSDKLEVVSGLDLLKGSQEELETGMRQRIADIENVTHVYFFAYIMDADPEKEISINVDLLKRAVTGVEHLSSNLHFVVLPTGTKVRLMIEQRLLD
jgi:nucleoside-diphosphate-sugar epimerase